MGVCWMTPSSEMGSKIFNFLRWFQTQQTTAWIPDRVTLILAINLPRITRITANQKHSYQNLPILGTRRPRRVKLRDHGDEAPVFSPQGPAGRHHLP